MGSVGWSVVALMATIFGGTLICGVIQELRTYARCKEPVEAVCTRIEFVGSSGGGVSSIVEFEYQYNNRVRRRTCQDSYQRKPKAFKEGDTVVIYVDPEKPDCFTSCKRKLGGGHICVIIFAIFMFALAIESIIMM